MSAANTECLLPYRSRMFTKTLLVKASNGEIEPVTIEGSLRAKQYHERSINFLQMESERHIRRQRSTRQCGARATSARLCTFPPGDIMRRTKSPSVPIIGQVTWRSAAICILKGRAGQCETDGFRLNPSSKPRRVPSGMRLSGESHRSHFVQPG